jgi:hypothetical protein
MVAPKASRRARGGGLKRKKAALAKAVQPPQFYGYQPSPAGDFPPCALRARGAQFHGPGGEGLRPINRSRNSNERSEARAGAVWHSSSSQLRSH